MGFFWEALQPRLALFRRLGVPCHGYVLKEFIPTTFAGLVTPHSVFDRLIYAKVSPVSDIADHCGGELLEPLRTRHAIEVDPPADTGEVHLRAIHEVSIGDDIRAGRIPVFGLLSIECRAEYPYEAGKGARQAPRTTVWFLSFPLFC